MSDADNLTLLIDKLHETHGRCGHCGGLKCPDRRKWSVLPDVLRIRTDDLIAAIEDIRKRAKGDDNADE